MKQPTKTLEKNVLGHPVEWVWVMRKLNTPLSVSSYPIGTKMGAAVFGYPVPLSNTWYDHGDIYFDREEMELVKTFLRYKDDVDPTYPDQMSKEIFTLAQRIERHTINAKRLRGRSLPSLIRLFRREQQLFLRMIGFMSYRGSIQMSDLLTEKLTTILSYRLSIRNKAGRLRQYLERLSTPLFESVVAAEKAYALRLSQGFNRLSQDQRKRRIKSYRRRFEWLAYHWFVGHPRTDDELRARFSRLASNAAHELRRMHRQRQQQERTVRTIVRQLSLNNSEQHVLRQYRTWLFLRTFVKDNINLAGYKLLPILYAIAANVGIPQHSIPFLTLDEIHGIRTFSTSQLTAKIASRHRGFSAGIIGLKFLFRPFVRQSATDQRTVTSDVRGQIAFRGKVTGIARVVHSPRGQSRVRRGDILITSMTTPDLLPAMERAAAFVTDEGGITCHAAIVARNEKAMYHRNKNRHQGAQGR